MCARCAMCAGRKHMHNRMWFGWDPKARSLGIGDLANQMPLIRLSTSEGAHAARLAHAGDADAVPAFNESRQDQRSNKGDLYRSGR
jgi:hypothetical protein